MYDINELWVFDSLANPELSYKGTSFNQANQDIKEFGNGKEKDLNVYLRLVYNDGCCYFGEVKLNLKDKNILENGLSRVLGKDLFCADYCPDNVSLYAWEMRAKAVADSINRKRFFDSDILQLLSEQKLSNGTHRGISLVSPSAVINDVLSSKAYESAVEIGGLGLGHKFNVGGMVYNYAFNGPSTFIITHGTFRADLKIIEGNQFHHEAGSKIIEAVGGSKGFFDFIEKGKIETATSIDKENTPYATAIKDMFDVALVGTQGLSAADYLVLEKVKTQVIDNVPIDIIMKDAMESIHGVQKDAKKWLEPAVFFIKKSFKKKPIKEAKSSGR